MPECCKGLLLYATALCGYLGSFGFTTSKLPKVKPFFTKKYPGVFVTVQDIKIFCFLPFAYFFIGYVGHFPGTIGNGERILIEADDSAWSDQTVL